MFSPIGYTKLRNRARDRFTLRPVLSPGMLSKIRSGRRYVTVQGESTTFKPQEGTSFGCQKCATLFDRSRREPAGNRFFLHGLARKAAGDIFSPDCRSLVVSVWHGVLAR